MAADINARRDKHSTIAFTLPISCQICLGKVKQPVLCPNNHVFCSQCMDVWLQRNQQCPACRITINPANPVRQILGGLNEAMDDKDRLSNPELRKARFDVLYREYEEEFERLNAENNLLKTEVSVLKQQLQKRGPDGKTSSKDIGLPKTADTNGLLLLTKKLQDAQRLYEKVKIELAKTKEENNSLKEENVNINHENQKLRGEIANRSPHRYGRYTVSTLEAKIQSYEKEVGQLNKALEKSDKYIEEMQTELGELRTKSKADTLSSQPSKSSYTRFLPPDPPLTSGYGVDGSHKRQLFGEESSDKKKKPDDQDYMNGESHKYAHYDDQSLHERYKSYDTKASMKPTASKNGSKSKRVTFDLPRDKSETISFDLEMPSPMTSKLSLTNGSSDSPIKGVLKHSKKSSTAEMSDSFSLSKPSSLDDSLFDTRRKPSTQRYSKDDDDLFRPTSRRSDFNESFSLEHPGRGSDRHDQELDDTQAIQSELDELDISLTPDFTDCMKLLNRAEKKVSSHGDEEEEDMDSEAVYRPTKDYLGNYRSKVDPLDHKDDFKSKPDVVTQDFKSRDDFKSYSKTEPSRTDTTYSSKYYNPRLEEDFKPSAASKSSYGVMVGDADSVSSKYRTSQSDTDTIGNKYRTVLSTATSYKSDLSSKTDSDQYSVPSTSTSSSERYTDNYNAGGGDATRYRRSVDRDLLPPRTTSASLPPSKPNSMYSSASSALQNKPSLSGKPLSQSGFGRSPSVDNLFMSPKSSQSTGSRYATAEDIPSFKSKRLSLPSYSSSTSSKPSVSKFTTGSYESDRQGRALPGSLSETNQEYSKASLPPRPSRTRPYSDYGATAGSYAMSATNMGTSARSSLESAYPSSSRFDPAPSSSRYTSAPLSSSTSTTSYLPTTVTSISASNTYSTAHPPSRSTYPAASLTSTYPSSSAYPSSAPPPTSSYTSKPLDLETATKGGYSYLSNNSSLGEFSKSDSYLPEPKKRLFESSDDFDVSLSPIKSTRKM
ncbi:serine-rich adhesin for platelets-like [Ylistrum balloti]|uniref:serine-rich adhesin for platelets-like n=1 Tax=Ylistrum balloti TaxID=509963 RepID=UPI002905A956|nr:serine-rich adhesin for platelets-like [Ylistrum balloti]